MDLGEALGYGLTAARLVLAVRDLCAGRTDEPETRPHPAPPPEGPDQGEEVDAMSARSIKVLVEVFPGRTDETMKVRASGKWGTLLFGKIRVVAFHQAITTGTTEAEWVRTALTQAAALVE